MLMFVIAADAVWIMDVSPPITTDVLSSRLGLGEVLGGLIFLAIATNLSGVTIIVSSALGNNLGGALGTPSAATTSYPCCSCWRISTR